MNMWKELGIAPTGDIRAIKRAYAQRLKQVHPEDDPDGFQRLRQAFEAARSSVSSEEDDSYKPLSKIAQESRLARRPQAESLPEPYPIDDAVSMDRVVEPAGESELWLAPPEPSVLSSSPREFARETATEGLPLTSQPLPEGDPPVEQEVEQHSEHPATDLLPPQRPVAVEYREQEEPSTSLAPIDIEAEVAQLIKQMSHSRARSADVLAEFMQAPAFQSLHARAAFEAVLIGELSARIVELSPLVAHFIKQFEWDARTQQVTRSRDDEALLRFMLRWSSLTWVRNNMAAPTNTRRPEALRLLTSAFNEDAFRWFSRRHSGQDAMRRLIAELQHQHQQVLDHWVPPENLAWWQKTLQRHPLTWDAAVGLFLLGLFGSVIPIQLLGDYAKGPLVGLLAIAISMGASFGLSAAFRAYGRRSDRGELDDFKTRFRNWRMQPQRRGMLLGLAWLAIMVVPVFGQNPEYGTEAKMALVVGVVAVLALLYSLVFVFWVAIMALAFNATIMMLLKPAVPHVPWLSLYADSTVFRQLAGMLVYPPFMGAVSQFQYAFTRNDKADTGGVVVVCSLFVPLVLFIATTAIEGGDLSVGLYYAVLTGIAVMAALMALGWRQADQIINRMVAATKRGVIWFRVRENRWCSLPITIALLAGSSSAEVSPWGIACAIASVVIFLMWVGLVKGLWVLIGLCWPTTGVVFLLLLPVVEAFADDLAGNHLIVLHYLMSVYLFVGLMRVCNHISIHIRGGPPADLRKATFMSSVALLMVALFFHGIRVG